MALFTEEHERDGLMSPTRRAFLKISAGGAVASILGFDLKPAYAQSRELKIARTTETRSTCPYCSVSCGVIIHTLGDKAKNVTPQAVSYTHLTLPTTPYV